jgi:hypothetical protein
MKNIVNHFYYNIVPITFNKSVLVISDNGLIKIRLNIQRYIKRS